MLRFASFLLIFNILACSPKVNKKEDAPNDSINKPELSKITTLAQPDSTSSKLNLDWNGDYSTSDVNLTINDFIVVGQKLNEPKFLTLANKLYSKTHTKDFSWGDTFSNLPYMSLFRKRALPEVKKEVKKIENELNLSLSQTKKIVVTSRNKIKWPKSASFQESVYLLEQVLKDLEVKFAKANLFPDFKSELTEQFLKEKNSNLIYLKEFSANLKTQLNLTFLIKEIRKLAQEYTYTLDSETEELLVRAANLGVKIDKVRNEVTALEAIITVWLFLDKADREAEIKPISDSLYDFLAKRSDEEVKCLIDAKCTNLWDFLLKNLFILPKISDFGPKNIQKKLNERSYAKAASVLDRKFYDVVFNIHKRINKMLDKGVAKGKERLLQIDANTQKYVDSKLTHWLSTNDLFDENSLLSTVQWPFTKIVKINNSFYFYPINRDNSILKETIGTDLQLTRNLIENAALSETAQKRLLLEKINILFSLGGIPEEFPDKSNFKNGFVRNLKNPGTSFNLTKAIASTDVFSLEDKIYLKAPLLQGRVDTNFKLSAKASAQFILGLLEFVDYFKDWKENRFDHLLGKVKPSDIFGSEPIVGEQPIFSKVKLFGYVTGHLANILSNFNKELTPIALIDSNNQTIWSNNLNLNNSNAFLYSAFVNVENNFKAETMRLEDMTLLIHLLARLIETVEGIERTQFPEFTKPLSDLNGKSVVQIIHENIQKVSKAFIPLGNTIATKMKKLNGSSDAGLIYNQVNIYNFQNFSVKYYLSDQLMALDAMLLVYEKTKIESYLWAALEVFNYLQQYYNPKTNFLHFNDEVPSVPLALQLLKSMINIKPYLQKNEQIILQERIRFLHTALLEVN